MAHTGTLAPADQEEKAISGFETDARPEPERKAATYAGRRGSSRAFLMLASTAFSLLLHGSVLAAAYLWLDDSPGAIAPPTDAISLELFQTEVLEAVAIAPSIEAAASLASVEQEPGEPVESLDARSAPEVDAADPPEDVAAHEEIETPNDVSVAGIEALQGSTQSETAVGQEHARPKPAKERTIDVQKRPAKPLRTAKLTDPTKTQDGESAPRKKGAAASRAAKGSAASSARISASTGSAVNYAAQVRARVASRKPAGGGKRGTVVIAFGVTRSGGLGYASIARSSGNPGLDRTVLSAVRSAAPFPTPPPGAQLRFAVPFHFR